MNRRSTIAALLTTGNFARPTRSEAQAVAMPRRIGFLIGSANPAASEAVRHRYTDAFANLGWIEGRNIVTTFRDTNGEMPRMDELAAELVALNPDVIVTTGSGAGALALQRVTRTVPIVFAGTIDPVGLGLVVSVARPGGNVTGVAASTGPELYGKRLQLFKEWLPKLSRLAVMFNPLDGDNAQAVVDIRRYATQFGIRVEEFGATNALDLDATLAHIQNAKPDAVYLVGSALLLSKAAKVCDGLASAGIPSTSGNLLLIESGCLFGYLTLLSEYAKESAALVDQILRGAKPAELPVRQPTRYELVINAKTAKALGLKVPQALLFRADRVIE